MILLYDNSPLFVGEFNYRLGGFRWDLKTLKAKGLLSGHIKPLLELGYRHCFGLGEDETLLSLARDPRLAHVEQRCSSRGRGASLSGGKRRFAA